MEVARHRTAMARTDLSRPLRLALADGLLPPGSDLMDYGCGRGGDVARLRGDGYDCSGWDPVHAPDGPRRAASVVNLGYVVNVIERAEERVETLRRAWSLARDVLVVSARLVDERPERGVRTMGDGVLTRLGTFQRFYEQRELRDWIEATLGEEPVAAAPGVFYVFRAEPRRAAFAASRFRRRAAVPRMRVTERLLSQNREILDRLAAFLAERGRPPADGEMPGHEELVSALGSVRRAHRLLVSASGEGAWEAVRESRAEDLLVWLALAAFDRRPVLSALPLDMQRDVRAFFGTYAEACRRADAMLRAIGVADRLDEAAAAAPVGKLLPTALYVHVDAVGSLPAALRLYEGCARAMLGSVDGATLVKLRRDEPKVSYLCYPDFERDPHPALAESVSAHLQTFRVRTRRYAASANPPVLHRKEAFVEPSHPRRGLWARLTRAEERAGLFDDTASIGTREGWRSALALRGLALSGHRLIRDASS